MEEILHQIFTYLLFIFPSLIQLYFYVIFILIALNGQNFGFLETFCKQT